MHLPDSPAWKSKQSKKKKALQEQQEKYGPTLHRSHSEPAAQHQHSSSGPKGKFSGRKPGAGDKLLPGDDLFAAMVLRQAHLRKRAAGLQHRRFAEPPRLNSKGEIVEVRHEECEARQQTHQECAAEIISELAGAAKARSQSQNLSQDLKLEDRNWSQSMTTQRDMGMRNRNPSQRESIDAAELVLSPWEALVHRHRRNRKLAEAAAAAGENTDPGPAALEQQHSASDSEASSESMEEPKVQPSVPSWDCPGNSMEQPAPPPMPHHWQEFHDRKKEHEKMEKEKELKRERWERERERRACKQESQDKIKQEYAWQDGQKKRKRRGQTASQFSSAPPGETNTSDSEIEPSSSAWRPWRCFFPRRHPGKAKLPGRAGRWGRGWRWGSAKVAPECSSKPGDEEPTAQEGNSAATVNLPGDNLVSEIDEELDQARGLPQQERKKIFRELQRRIHPDKNLADQDAAKLAFQYLMDNRTSFLKS